MTPHEIAKRPPFIRVKYGRAINDPEKLVTPGILYTSDKGEGLTVHLIAFGWWDWHISFMWHTRSKPAVRDALKEMNE